MSYYFSYDAFIPDYLQEDGLYTKDQLHCTLAYSKEDFSEQHLEKLNLLNVPEEQLATVIGVAILNNHITLLINNPNLMVINKNILSQFSIVEDYNERLMHVSIKKNLKETPVNLKYFEDKYCGKTIILNHPKLFINQPNSEEKQIVYINTIEPTHKLNIK